MLSLLRMVAALLFIEHGTMKLIHFPIPQPGVPAPLPILMVVAACLEIGGGLLLALGLLTRPVAFILTGEMAVAYFTAASRKARGPASTRAARRSSIAGSSSI